jgi:hypothetical protein
METTPLGDRDSKAMVTSVRWRRPVPARLDYIALDVIRVPGGRSTIGIPTMLPATRIRSAIRRRAVTTRICILGRSGLTRAVLVALLRSAIVALSVSERVIKAVLIALLQSAIIAPSVSERVATPSLGCLAVKARIDRVALVQISLVNRRPLPLVPLDRSLVIGLAC